jgi:hypothetical protein
MPEVLMEENTRLENITFISRPWERHSVKTSDSAQHVLIADCYFLRMGWKRWFKYIFTGKGKPSRTEW